MLHCLWASSSHAFVSQVQPHQLEVLALRLLSLQKFFKSFFVEPIQKHKRLLSVSSPRENVTVQNGLAWRKTGGRDTIDKATVQASGLMITWTQDPALNRLNDLFS